MSLSNFLISVIITKHQINSLGKNRRYKELRTKNSLLRLDTSVRVGTFTAAQKIPAIFLGLSPSLKHASGSLFTAMGVRGDRPDIIHNVFGHLPA